MNWPIRRRFRLVWFISTILILLLLPALIWYLIKIEYQIDTQVSIYGGIFMALTLPITIYEVLMHLEYYTCPEVQKYVIRISWMVPFYSVVSWLGLAFHRARLYLDPLRECYEAFVIYSFYCYLCSYLENVTGDLTSYLALEPNVDHVWGFQLICSRWRMGRQFLWNCKKGVLSYVVIRPILAVMGFISISGGFYNDGQVSGMWFWIFNINNICQLWAIYCLIMFYRATKRQLVNIRPVAKFLLIKAIVFLTFWQSIAISLIFSLGLISTDGWVAFQHGESAASGIQNFAICIEMFIAAIVFAYVFPPKDYMKGSELTEGFLKNLSRMFDVDDVVEDVSSMVGDRVSKSTDMTSGVIHKIGSFFKSPKEFMKYQKWRSQSYKVKKNGSFDDTNPKMLWRINSLSSSFLIRDSYMPPSLSVKSSQSEPSFHIQKALYCKTRHNRSGSRNTSSIASTPTFEIDHE